MPIENGGLPLRFCGYRLDYGVLTKHTAKCIDNSFMQFAALRILLYDFRRHEADGDAESRRPGDFLPIMNMDDRSATCVARTNGTTTVLANNGADAPGSSRRLVACFMLGTLDVMAYQPYIYRWEEFIVIFYQPGNPVTKNRMRMESWRASNRSARRWLKQP